MNDIKLLGYACNDPEIKNYEKKDGTQGLMASYRLGVRRRGLVEETDFFNIKAFGKNAEITEKYISKGSHVLIDGNVRTGSYEDKEGIRRYTFEVIVEYQYLLDSKKGKLDDVISEDTNQSSEVLSEDEQALLLNDID